MKKIISYIYKKCWDIIANPILDYIQITEITTKVKKVDTDGRYKKGRVNCKLEEQKAGIDVKSQVTMSLFEVDGESGFNFIDFMKHKKRWSKSATNAYYAKFGPKDNLTEESCLMCVAVLGGVDLDGDGNFTYAFSGSCPDYDDEQVRMRLGENGWIS